MSGKARRRLVLDLCHCADDADTLRAAAEFARLLNLDLHCLFIEDEALLSLSELPFARELRLPACEWSPLRPTTVVAELHHQAEHVRRRLDQVLRRAAQPSRFEVLRGDPAVCLAGACAAGDVVILAAPRAAGACLAHGLARLRAAAHACPASVLLLPPGHQARPGSVAVLLADLADESLAVACRMALAANETVTALLPGGPDAPPRHALAQRALACGLPESRLSIHHLRGASGDEVWRAVGPRPVRLIVLRRAGVVDAPEELATELSARQGVPVLLLEAGCGSA